MKNERVISPIKGRLLHHIIECRTPNKKINNKKMDLSIIILLVIYIIII